MKRYLLHICVLFGCWQVYADEPQQFYYGTDYSVVPCFYRSVVSVDEGAIVSVPGDTIPMNTTVYLYNNGTINATIDTNGYNLFVYNSGELNGGITNISGGNVTQIIRSNSEMTNIDIDTDTKIIKIDGFENVNLNDIIGMNASCFVIKDSSVVIDDFSDWQQWDANVHLEGPVAFVINNASTVNSGEVINHTVYGDVITVKITDLDVMYTTQQVLQNGGIALNIVRETNYDVIFGNDSEDGSASSALELIRELHPKDRLLKALDKADDMDEFNRLKKLSYRFSHDILLRPMKVVNNFSFIDMMNDENISGVGMSPHYIMSDKIDGVGGRIYVGYKYDNLYFNAGMNINRIKYSDDLNEFSGMSYGLDIKSKQTFGKFWLNEILGFSLTDYDAEYVSSNDRLRKNPLGMSWYADIGGGYDFNIMPDITLAPIVGIMYQHYDVADVSDNDSGLHGGANVKYSFVMDGIKYEYGLSGGISTDGNLFTTMKIGFLSVTDNAGISIDVNVFKDDFDYYYKFALNAKILF